MILEEMIKNVLSLIEEISPDNEMLTEDPDIAQKIHSVINQVMFELARIKKIPASTEEDMTAGEVFDLNTISDFYQLRQLRIKNKAGQNVKFELIDSLCIPEEDGTATIIFYKFPERITSDTSNSYEFEQSQDVLEIMTYGVAADLLKSDVSTGYGKIYADRYESMLQRLDPRYSTGMISIEGGVDI